MRFEQELYAITKRIPHKREMRRLYYARHLLGGRMGIEIGGLNYPLLPNWLRFPPVTFIDRYDSTMLRQHYPELADQPIVDVSLIADAHQLPFRDNTLDFIIANHVIEHMEHLFTNLKDYHRILRPGGKLYAALPDWTYSWDHPRERTTYNHLLTEYLRPEIALQNREVHYLEWARAMAEADFTDYTADDEDIIRSNAQYLRDVNYSIHFHVWCGSDFVRHIERMSRDLDFGFDVVEAGLVENTPTWRLVYGEFIVVLQKR